MKIDILSDPICPWCYIGKKKLEAALATYPRDLGDINKVWRTFQLNPDMPVEGMDRQDYLERKFGGKQGAAQVYGNIKNAGAEIGIDFDFDAISKTPNTMRAHRLIRFAMLAGVGDEVKQSLMEAYFELGTDIGNVNELAFIAAKHGLDRDEVTAFLMGSDYADELKTEDQSARQSGVSGVPFFIIEDKYALSGAQPPEAFHKIFDLVLDGVGGEHPNT